MNVFRVLRDPERAARLAAAIELTPYARCEFEDAYDEAEGDDVERARRTLLRAGAGFGSSGATKAKTGFRAYSGSPEGARGPNPADAWAKLPQRIAEYVARLRGVIIECRPALEVIAAHDSSRTLHYVDPPYLRSLRCWGRTYRHEMSDADHVALLECLRNVSGYVVLSGYDSELYRAHLQGWTCCGRGAMASGREGSVPRNEVLWLNPRAAAASAQRDLFEGVSA